MVATLKNLILKNWTLWRVIRMVLAFVFIINGALKSDTILITGGVFLFFHALLNTCAACSDGNCEIPQK